LGRVLESEKQGRNETRGASTMENNRRRRDKRLKFKGRETGRRQVNEYGLQETGSQKDWRRKTKNLCVGKTAVKVRCVVLCTKQNIIEI
jgi:hypothetical protein